MTSEAFLFFRDSLAALPIYEALVSRMQAALGPYDTKVQKTQIAFANRYNFAFASLPLRKIRGRPDVCLIVTFGLRCRVEHPRIEQAVEPYPNRWTHHVIVAAPGEVDDQLLAWLQQAYAFAQTK